MGVVYAGGRVGRGESVHEVHEATVSGFYLGGEEE